jgi:DNA-binding ferritin-like protein
MRKDLTDEVNERYVSVGYDALLLASQNDTLATRALERLEEGVDMESVIASLVPEAMDISTWPNYDPCNN